MTTTHEPRHRDTPAWRYWAILATATLVAGVAVAQTFGDVAAATLDTEPLTPPSEPLSAQPLPEVAERVPLL